MRFNKNDLIKDKKSLKYKLISTFLIVSIIPLFIAQVIFYILTINKMKNNVYDLVNLNLKQTQKSLNLTLESYEDFLYRIYSNKDIIKAIENINVNNDVTSNIEILQESLKNLCDSKYGIEGIQILTSKEEWFFYDGISNSANESQWIYNNKYFYNNFINSDEVITTTTRFAIKDDIKSYYVFEMAHKIISNTNENKSIGVVVISINSDVLESVCKTNEYYYKANKITGINYIYDKYRNIVYFPDKRKLGRNLKNYHIESIYNKDSINIKLVENDQYFTEELEIPKDENFTITELTDDNTGWTIAYLQDENELYTSIKSYQVLYISIGILANILILLLIVRSTNRITSSINKIISAMNSVGDGDLLTEITIDPGDVKEVCIIANNFNKMVNNLRELVEKVKYITMRQKEAEIKALEAQINPHFLYNTLDTINWKAIEKDEYEISNMINALAKILRYAVQDSNKMVVVRDELEWVKEYILLQQSRLNSPFKFVLDVDEKVLNYKIYKLILQPFLENSIIHGFEECNEQCILKVSIKEYRNLLKISIVDNGRGMSKTVLQKFIGEELTINTNGEHIGVNNVIGRLKMYYGNSSKFNIKSELGKGTEINIMVPKYL